MLYRDLVATFSWDKLEIFRSNPQPFTALVDHDGIAVERFSGDIRQTMTFGELRSKALRLAAFMKESGVQKGDVIAVLASKKVEQVVVLLAT